MSFSLFSSVQFHSYRFPALAPSLHLDPDPHYFRSGTFHRSSYLICLSTLPFLVSHTSYILVVLVLLPAPVYSFCQPLCSSSSWMWAAHWTTFTTLPLHPFLFFCLNGSQCLLLNYVQIQIPQPPYPSCSPYLAELLPILQSSQTGLQSNMDQVTENTGEQKLKPKYIRGANTEKFSSASSVWREPSGSWEGLAGLAEYITPEAFSIVTL